VTQLGAHGIGVTLPAGWEGRVFRRPAAGELSAATADGVPAPPGETTHAVMHVATIALPAGTGDFASGAVDRLGHEDALIVLFEYGSESVGQPLFAAPGIPKNLRADQFSPGVLQRTLRGQAGAQLFFNDSGRAFCLYVVLGSYANRRKLVPAVNEVLDTLTVDGLAAGSSTPTPSTTTTTVPTSTTAPTSTTTTTAPPDVPSTTGPTAP
jgi:hypothetical protein